MRFCIFPYKESGIWYFDHDELLREPFVQGAPEVIEELIADFDEPETPFRLHFSNRPFDGWQMELAHEAQEWGGDWYCETTLGLEAWLCPILLRFFAVPPCLLYIAAEPLTLECRAGVMQEAQLS